MFRYSYSKREMKDLSCVFLKAFLPVNFDTFPNLLSKNIIIDDRLGGGIGRQNNAKVVKGVISRRYQQMHFF